MLSLRQRHRCGTGMVQGHRPGIRRCMRKDGEVLEKTDLWLELVYERFQSVFGDIGGQIDGWCQGGAILIVQKLDDDVWDRFFWSLQIFWLRNTVVHLLSFRWRYQYGHFFYLAEGVGKKTLKSKMESSKRALGNCSDPFPPARIAIVLQAPAAPAQRLSREAARRRPDGDARGALPSG